MEKMAASYTVSGKIEYDPIDNVGFEIKVEPSRTWTLGRCQKVTVTATMNFKGEPEKLAYSEKLNLGNGIIRETYTTAENEAKLEKLASKMAHSLTHNDNPPWQCFYGLSETLDETREHRIYAKTCVELEKVTGIAPEKRSHESVDERKFYIGFRRRVPPRRFPSQSRL